MPPQGASRMCATWRVRRIMPRVAGWRPLDHAASSLSDLGCSYCAGGKSGAFFPDFSLHRTTMRLEIMKNCPRSPTRLAMGTQVRQAPRQSVSVHDLWQSSRMIIIRVKESSVGCTGLPRIITSIRNGRVSISAGRPQLDMRIRRIIIASTVAGGSGHCWQLFSPPSFCCQARRVPRACQPGNFFYRVFSGVGVRVVSRDANRCGENSWLSTSGNGSGRPQIRSAMICAPSGA